MNTYTGLESIHLQNYRCFADLAVKLDKYLTVLVANNGAGKTTVLDAVAVSLRRFVSTVLQGQVAYIFREDVFLKVMDSEVLEMEAQYPCAIKAEGILIGEPFSWLTEKNRHEGATFGFSPVKKIGEAIKEKLANENTNTSVVLPVIAYYGTGRLWNHLATQQTNDDEFNAGFFSRTAGYQDCLNPASSYKSFVEWFRYASEAHSQLLRENYELHGAKGLEMDTPYLALLRGVNQAVEICLEDTGWRNLRFSSIHKEPVVEHSKNGVLPVSQLSDGIRNMIAMIADIAYRAARLNKQFKENAPIESPGIILIDEVDMHLHPKWQQQVLTQLRKAFPAMQFIVTTHSPQVLSTIPSEHIRLLTTNIDGETIAAIPLAESYARSNADVLETVMHVDSMPEVKESPDLKRYNDMIEQGDLQASEAKDLRKKLEETLGTNHPVLMQLDAVKRRRELLG